MTDVISAPGSDTDALSTMQTQGDAVVPSASLPSGGDDQPLAWAPIEPKPKKKRLGLWIGLGLGVLLLGAGGASAILIAPGTTVAGISVGWLTPGAAADAIRSHVADTRISLTGDGEGTVLTGADLGAAIDATALADKAFAEHPMWNLGSWGDTVAGEITLDPAKADAALRGAVPTSFEDPLDAAVAFDAATGVYAVTPGEPGTAIDIEALTAAIADAVADGDRSLEFSGDPTVALPAVTDEDATAMATSLNTLLGTIGFYVGDERTVPVAPATAASWLKIVDENGELRIVADQQTIQATVDTLPGLIDRAPVNATNIVDSAGTVLRAQTEGANGRTLGDTSDVAAEFASKLESADGIFALDVTEVPFETVNLARRIEIDISEQRAWLFENGNVVNTYRVSTGLPGTPTPTGNFKVFAHTRMQDMGCYEGAPYCTEDVPWITWFTTNIGFHGTYWHNNFGNRMSHGCVNLPVDLAKYVYDWSPVGLEVSVRA